MADERPQHIRRSLVRALTSFLIHKLDMGEGQPVEDRRCRWTASGGRRRFEEWSRSAPRSSPPEVGHEEPQEREELEPSEEHTHDEYHLGEPPFREVVGPHVEGAGPMFERQVRRPRERLSCRTTRPSSPSSGRQLGEVDGDVDGDVVRAEGVHRSAPSYVTLRHQRRAERLLSSAGRSSPSEAKFRGRTLRRRPTPVDLDSPEEHEREHVARAR